MLIGSWIFEMQGCVIERTKEAQQDGLPPQGEGVRRTDGGIKMQHAINIPPSARWAPSPGGGRPSC